MIGPAAPAVVLNAHLDASSASPVAVAFSGGGDSLALLLAAMTYSRDTGRRIVALTVDHRLHPDSAAWTARAAETAQALGADWRGLDWSGAKPAAGLPAAARAARHRLLARAARQVGAKVLLTGHTADDLAESLWMRRDLMRSLPLMRRWGPSPVWPEGRGLFLLRPLLDQGRADLRDSLRRAGHTWLDDPANEDRRFSRTRARLALRTQAATTPPVTDAPSAAPMDVRLTGAVRFDPWGGADLDLAELTAAPPEAGRRVLAVLSLCIGGGERPPRSAPLAQLLETITQARPCIATLGGARFQSDGVRLRITPETGRRRLDRSAQPLVDGVFDGRFEADAGAELARLAGWAGQLSKEDRRRLAACPADIRPSLPVVLAPGVPPALPRPFGAADVNLRLLGAARFAAAGGRIRSEAYIEGPHPPSPDPA